MNNNLPHLDKLYFLKSGSGITHSFAFYVIDALYAYRLFTVPIAILITLFVMKFYIQHRYAWKSFKNAGWSRTNEQKEKLNPIVFRVSNTIVLARAPREKTLQDVSDNLKTFSDWTRLPLISAKKVSLFFDSIFLLKITNFPQFVMRPEKLPRKKWTLWLGQNAHNETFTINHSTQSAALVLGSGGSGKSWLLKLIVDEYLSNTPQGSVSIFTTKPGDYANILSNEKVKVIDSVSVDAICDETKAIQQKMEKTYAELSAKGLAGIYDTPELHSQAHLVLCDEASDYLRTDAVKGSENEKELKAKVQSIVATITKFITRGRAAGIYTVVATQGQKSDELDLDTSKFQLKIGSATQTEALSRALWGSPIAFNNPLLTRGVFVYTEGGIPSVFKGGKPS